MATPLSSIALVFCSSFIGSIGAAFLKSGAGRLQLSVQSLATNWRLATGVFAFLVSSVFYVMALDHGELSVLYPMVSLGYLWTMVWSRFIFHEPLTKFKFVGLGLILSGIVFLGMGNR
jgi:multidrug transporter EmrE-like cation transporter